LWKEDIAVAGGLIIVCRDCFVAATILGARRLRFLAVEIPICRAIVVFYIVLLYSCVEVSSPRNVNAQLDEYWKEQKEIPGTRYTPQQLFMECQKMSGSSVLSRDRNNVHDGF
jgi:hypothetical protein